MVISRLYIPDYSSPTDAMDQKFFGRLFRSASLPVAMCAQIMMGTVYVYCSKVPRSYGRDLRRTAPKRSELNYC